MGAALNLSRNQIAAFAKDPQTIKQFELLVSAINETVEIIETTVQAGTAQINDLQSEVIQLQDQLRGDPASFDPAAILESLQALRLGPAPFDPSVMLARLQGLEQAPPVVMAPAPLTFPARTITSTGTPLLTDFLLLVDASGGAVTVNLPEAAGSAGRPLVVKKIDAGTDAVTLDGDGAETIDGAATLVLAAQWDSVAIICDGTAWYIV